MEKDNFVEQYNSDSEGRDLYSTKQLKYSGSPFIRKILCENLEDSEIDFEISYNGISQIETNNKTDHTVNFSMEGIEGIIEISETEDYEKYKPYRSKFEFVIKGKDKKWDDIYLEVLKDTIMYNLLFISTTNKFNK